MNTWHKLCGAIAALTLVGSTLAADYPTKSIRLVVPFPPGGAGDTTARIVGEELGKRLGQTVVIDNKPGANTQLGIEQGARAEPDGYTLILISSGATILPITNKTFTLDLTKGLTPITLLNSAPLVLAVPASTPHKTLAMFLAHARSNPGKLNFGVSGPTDQLAGALLQSAANFKAVTVNYKGGAPALQAVAVDEVQWVLLPWGTLRPMVEAGKVRPLAVTTPSRYSPVPDLPTVSEAGIKGFEASFWFALMAPANTPKDIVTKLNTAVVATLREPAVTKRIQDSFMEPIGSTPDALGQQVASEVQTWAKVAQETGYKPD